jgi:hypothetical protein
VAANGHSGDHRRSSGDPDQVVDALREAFVREFGDPGRLPQRAILFEAIRHRPTRRSVVKRVRQMSAIGTLLKVFQLPDRSGFGAIAAAPSKSGV